MSKTQCVYCQERKEETRDHVPPDGIFAKPLPRVLITVPTCSICHKQFNLDDTHFLKLALEFEAAKTADGAKVSDKQIEKLREHFRENRRSGPAFVDSLRPVTFVTPEKPEGEPTFVIHIDRSRLITTATRIIRGLYFEVSNTNHKLKRALAPDCRIRVTMWDQPDSYLGSPSKKEFDQYLSYLNHRSLRDNVFEFWYRLSDEVPNASLWHLTVYGRFHFDGTTGTEEEIRAASEIWAQELSSAQPESTAPPGSPPVANA